LTPGAVVSVLVGGIGRSGTGGPNGGFNGGGTGGGAGGGGASDVRVDGTGLGNRVLIAGGGGGAATLCNFPNCSVGGAGGGTVGGHGTTTPTGSAYGGEGGSQSEGGTGLNGGSSGQSGLGGAGQSPYAGGGGGGYFGGAGAGYFDSGSVQTAGAGGGGSGFFNPDTTRVTGGTTFAGMREDSGLVRLSYTTAPVTATTTSVASSSNPSAAGQSVTFTATVSPNDGSGTVGFFADGSTTPLGGCGAVPLTDNGGSWQASCTTGSDFAPGTHPISADYSGSALYGPSSGSLAGGQQVGKQAQTITFPPQPNRSILDSPYTITGDSGGGSGNPVTFTAAGACTVSGHQVTLTHTGTCTLTAHQAGNATYAPAPAVSRSFTVTGKPSIRIADATTTEGAAGTHPLAFHVTLSRSVSVPVTVHWATGNGSARAPGDYVAASGTLTFSPGQTARTLSAGVKGDGVKEPNEVFYMLLSNPHNATTADPNASGGILNDD
jgi:hypothetical protein